MQFLISYPIRCLRTRRFCEPTFRPSGDAKHWKKHSVSRLLSSSFFDLPSYDFFSSETFSSLTLPTSAFPSCPSVHIVGRLTSKLPSMIYYCILCLTCFKSHLPSKSPILGSSTVPASPRHLHMEEELKLKPWSPEATPDTPGPGRGDFTDTNAENASGGRRMHHNL